MARPTDALTELRARELHHGADAVLDVVPRIARGYARPNHLRPLADLLARAVGGEAVRAVVAAPPRHGKSELLAAACAWALFVRPSIRIALVSYSAELAEARSRRVMELATRAGVRMAKDQRAVGAWRTAAGGEVRAVGVGGSLTGFGFDLIIVDDPIKNREEAESVGQRDSLASFFTSTCLSRLEPGASCLVAAARFHVDDLSGRLIDAGWPSVTLPAINDTGAALWPERWPVAALEARRAEVGAYDWASLYMGTPTPRGGQVFTGEPPRYTPADLTAVLRAGGARIYGAADPAATASSRADFSVVMVGVFAPTTPSTLYLVELRRLQCEIPTLCQVLREVQVNWGCALGCEANGPQKAVAQLLRTLNGGLRVVELLPRGDKFTRAQPAAAMWAAGRIKLPEAAPWVGPLLAEVASFTGAGSSSSTHHDDQVDTLSHLVTMGRVVGSADALERRRARMQALLPFG